MAGEVSTVGYLGFHRSCPGFRQLQLDVSSKHTLKDSSTHAEPPLVALGTDREHPAADPPRAPLAGGDGEAVAFAPEAGDLLAAVDASRRSSAKRCQASRGPAANGSSLRRGTSAGSAITSLRFW